MTIASEIAYGHVAETLCDIAPANSATQTCIRRTGRSSIVERPFGSVAGTLAQIAPVPRTVVPQADRDSHMKRHTETRALAGVAAATLSAGAAQARSMDDSINAAFSSATGWFVSVIFAPFPGTSFPWIVAWLVIAAAVFTLYFGFIQFRVIRHSIQLVRGDYSDPDDAGEISHFQALATALSGTVGLGNIAGVAVAIGIGGPGATFWMILAGLLGMASKFTECTLGVKYRNEYPDGTVSGGPMYYLTKGFAERGLPGGKVLAVMFAIFCILGSFGGGNMFQANQAHQQLAHVLGDYPGWITGVIFAAIVFVVIVGAAASLGPVIDFSDAAIFAMAVVNIIGLYVLMPIVKHEFESYLGRLKSGEIRKFA